jgi:hypothetical protein
MKCAVIAAAAGMLAILGLVPAGPADAGEREKAGTHAKSSHYRKSSGPQVRGYAARRGGYSYSYSDTINTYGDSRTLYGATQLFRDPMLDRQTNAGPFDHGFFFESGIAPRGGNSPYMN